MTKQDRQKLSILVVLLGVLGVTIVLGYRMNQPPITSAVRPDEPKTSDNPPAQNDARIRLDLVEKQDDKNAIGKKNVFQYRQIEAPPVPSRPPLIVPQATQTSAPPPVVTRPPGPPAPPPIQLKYQGFAAVNTGGALTAFISDESRHYNVKVGEFLLGRYRIANITEKAVEVEDLEFNRRQVLPLVK